MNASARIRSLLVLLVAAVLLAACGGSDDGDDTKAVTETETVTQTETSTTESEPTETNGGDATCSAADLDGDLLPQEGLPEPVATTRRELFDAARACNFDALQTIGERNKDGFAFSYGDQGGTAADYWRSMDEKDQVTRRIVQLLNVEYVDKRDDGPRTFAWPSAHSSTHTDAQWTALADSNAYTAAQVAGFRKDDMYYGLRIGILPDGRVTYIIAGD